MSKAKAERGAYIEMRERGYKGPPGPHLNHASLFTRTGEVDTTNRKAQGQAQRRTAWEIREAEKKRNAKNGH